MYVFIDVYFDGPVLAGNDQFIMLPISSRYSFFVLKLQDKRSSLHHRRNWKCLRSGL